MESEGTITLETAGRSVTLRQSQFDQVVDRITGELRDPGADERERPRQLMHPLVAAMPEEEHVYEVTETVVRRMAFEATDVADALAAYEQRAAEAKIVKRAVAVVDKGLPE